MDGLVSSPDLSEGNEQLSTYTLADVECELHMEKLAIAPDRSHQAENSATMDTLGQSLNMSEGEKQGIESNVAVPENTLPSGGDSTTMESSTLSLRRFPAEIRQMIFNEAITAPDVPRNSMEEIIPASSKQSLIEALRSEYDQTLYREALEIYFKKNTVEVTGKNLERIEGMSEDTLSLIKHMCITYSIPSPRSRTLTFSPFLHSTDKILLSTTTTLKSLTILFKPPITLSQACVSLPYELPVLINSFDILETLTIVFPNENDRQDVEEPYHGTENQQCVRDLMKTCREATRAGAMLWVDLNHQVIKVTFLAAKKPRGKGKGMATAKDEVEECLYRFDDGLKWKEERIGDGWVGECTCGRHHNELPDQWHEGVHYHDHMDNVSDGDEDDEDPAERGIGDPSGARLNVMNSDFTGLPLLTEPARSAVLTAPSTHEELGNNGLSFTTVGDDEANSWNTSPESSSSRNSPPHDEVLAATHANDTAAEGATMSSSQADSLASPIPPADLPNDLPPSEQTATYEDSTPPCDGTWDCVGVGGMNRALGWADIAEFNELDDIVTDGWGDDEYDEGAWHAEVDDFL